MSQLLTNSLEYVVTSENEIASILSKFNGDYLMDVIKSHLENKYNIYPNLAAPNIVASFEQNFKNLQNTYISDKENIAIVREQTYKNIIDIICKEYNLVFTDTGNLDYFAIAYYLYDSLVSNFINYITTFFSSYVYKEKNSLYDMLDMDALKKNKDTSTIYNKKLYKDLKLAILNANLEVVLNSMMQFDVPFEIVVGSVYFNNKAIVNTILSCVTSSGDFYKDFYCGAFRSEEHSPAIITNIRLAIQRLVDPKFTF